MNKINKVMDNLMENLIVNPKLMILIKINIKQLVRI
jgi:hypothetical protein